MSDFEKWFRNEVSGGRLYPADLEMAQAGWNAGIESAALLCENFETKVLWPAGKHICQDVDCYPETASACAKAIRTMKDEA